VNILVIHQYFLDKDQGGGSRFNQFVKFWTDMGHEVTVIAGMVHYATGEKPSKWKGRLIVEEDYEGAKVIRTYVSDKYNVSFLGRLFGYFSFMLSSLLAMFKIKDKPDVIIATSPPLFTGVTGFLLSLRFGCAFVFEVRDLWPESAIELGIIKNKFLIKASFWLEKAIYKLASRINVLTPAFKDAIVKKGISPHKIWLIPNGADLDLFSEEDVRDIRKEYGWDDKFVVLYIGAHGVANNLEQLIFAAEKLKEALPDVLFVLIGDGMEKPKLVKMVKEKGLDNVIFIPPQPKERIKDFVYAADVGIAVLKRVDVFKTVYPNKVFDYMCCKKPVILGIDGIARKLVVDEAKCGIYYEPENIDMLVDAVKMYYNDEKLRKEHGENGYRFVKANFDRKVLAKKYIDEIKAILTRP